MRTHRDWKSRVLDYLVYIAIGLTFVGIALVAAERISDPDLASQIVTAVFSGSIVIGYVARENWKLGRHQLLIVACAVVLLIHFGAYAVAYRFAGRTKAILAGSAIVVEIALFSYAIERVVRKERIPR